MTNIKQKDIAKFGKNEEQIKQGKYNVELAELNKRYGYELVAVPQIVEDGRLGGKLILVSAARMAEARAKVEEEKKSDIVKD